MIRKFVLVKENVTDFCCVLNVWIWKCPNSIFEILSGQSNSSIQTQNAVNFMMKEWKKMIKEWDKRMAEFLWFFVHIFGTIAYDNWISVLCLGQDF